MALGPLGGFGEKVVTPPPPPRARHSGHTCRQHIIPMALVGYRVFFGPHSKAKPVRIKTGKTVSYGIVVAFQG